MSNDEAIVSQLVKSRERCRQLVQLYQGAHEVLEDAGTVRPFLEKAHLVASQLLSHLRAFSGAPERHVHSAAMRSDAKQILMETGDLIEKVLAIEREFRESVQVMWSERRPLSI
jgi:hypothetical protein